MRNIKILLFISLLFMKCNKVEPKLENKLFKEKIENHLNKNLEFEDYYTVYEIIRIDTISSENFYEEKYNSYNNYFKIVKDYPERSKKFIEFAKIYRNNGYSQESQAIKSENLAKRHLFIYDSTKTNMDKFKNLLTNSKSEEIILVSIIKLDANENKSLNKVFLNKQLEILDLQE